jgi:hypothetical protein
MEVRGYQSGDILHWWFRVAVQTPDTPGKSSETPEIPESPGSSTPECLGFAAETLNHNAARYIHPNREETQI